MYMKRVKGYPLPLGISERGEYVNFSVAVSAGKSCQLIVREKGKKKPYMSFDMPKKDGIGEVRFLTLENFDFEKYEYDYKCESSRLTKEYCDRIGVACGVFDTLVNATNACYEKAVEGNVVLLSPACASWDQYKKFEDRGDEFKNTIRGFKGE